MDPVSTLIGSVLLGMGTILAYAAYKNRRVFGADGIIPQAISGGAAADLDNVPLATEGFASGAIGGAGGAKQASESVSKIENALSAITSVDGVLGTKIRLRVYDASPTSTRTDLMPLAQLLVLADARGLTDATSVIRNHIQAVTGERI
jgi:hypothetical protein